MHSWEERFHMFQGSSLLAPKNDLSELGRPAVTKSFNETGSPSVPICALLETGFRTAEKRTMRVVHSQCGYSRHRRRLAWIAAPLPIMRPGMPPAYWPDWICARKRKPMPRKTAFFIAPINSAGYSAPDADSKAAKSPSSEVAVGVVRPPPSKLPSKRGSVVLPGVRRSRKAFTVWIVWRCSSRGVAGHSL